MSSGTVRDIMALISVILLLMLVCVHGSSSYNILVVFAHPGKSHVDVFTPMLRELDARGHNITVLGYIPQADNSSRNIRDIKIGAAALREVMDLKEFPDSLRLRSYLGISMISNFGAGSCQESLSSPALQSFLKENNSFDVILFEFFNSNCLFGLVNKFKVPFIGLSSSGMMPWHPNWFGTPENPSVSQNIFTGFEHPMSFFNRVENTVLRIVSHFWYKYGMEKPGNELSKKYIGEEAADPHLASLYLVNSHYTIHGARPLSPSIVEVGGIHVNNRKPKMLPKALESWINNSDVGVIYLSFGSMIKGNTFPEEKQRAFTAAFARLRQRVLWKWENDTMPDKPDNVMIYKWMPQFDILCNPNVKAFISHGGLLGSIEAIHCGVPIIIMPQFGDQMHNSRALEAAGAGRVLHLSNVTEDNLYEALQTVLHPDFQKQAKELSEKFKDRPLSPINTAIYWIEHVARHKGTSHMRALSIDMPFYQYFLLDVISFLALVTSILIYVSYKITRLTLVTLVGKPKIKQKSL